MGTVAALGVALGSISAVLVGVFAKFVELGWWIPVALLGIVLAISGPSMLIAWLKLRQRSLGPLLDASGWAINGRMRINVPLGGIADAAARSAAGAERRLRDPYRQSRVGRYLALLAVVAVGALIVAWRMGLLGTVGSARLTPEMSARSSGAAARAGAKGEGRRRGSGRRETGGAMPLPGRRRGARRKRAAPRGLAATSGPPP